MVRVKFSGGRGGGGRRRRGECKFPLEIWKLFPDGVRCGSRRSYELQMIEYRDMKRAGKPTDESRSIIFTVVNSLSLLHRFGEAAFPAISCVL